MCRSEGESIQRALTGSGKVQCWESWFPLRAAQRDRGLWLADESPGIYQRLYGQRMSHRRLCGQRMSHRRLCGPAEAAHVQRQMSRLLRGVRLREAVLVARLGIGERGVPQTGHGSFEAACWSCTPKVSFFPIGQGQSGNAAAHRILFTRRAR